MAGMRRHDHRAVFHPHAIKLAETGPPGQLLEIDVHHLPDVREPGSAVCLDAEAKLILLLQDDKCWLRHEIFVYRAERSAAVDPHIARMQPVPQMGERGNFVKPSIRLPIFEDQFPFGRSQMTDRHTIRQNTASPHVEHFQGRDRCKQRIVPATRVERECLKESPRKLPDVPMLLGRHHQRRHVAVLDHGFKAGLDLQQPMPADFSVYRLDCIFIGIIGSLQGQNRVEEQSQRLGRFHAGVHVTLLFPVVDLREQPAHQLDEHRHCIVGELLAELDNLHHDRRTPAAGAKFAGEPGRCCITFPDHLVPSSGVEAGL